MPAIFNHSTGAFRVCVDGTEEGRIRGRILGRRLTAPIPFGDLPGLLLPIEGVLDAQSFPRTFERRRTLTPKGASPPVPSAASLEDGLPAEAVDAARGEAATFLIYVVTRRQATWQGFVNWLDGGPLERYRSVWELIRMLERRLPGLS